MAVFVLSFIIILLLFVAMSIGVLMGRNPVQGSCGGMSALGMDTACDICGGDPAACKNASKPEPNGRDRDGSLSYDAMDESAER